MDDLERWFAFQERPYRQKFHDTLARMMVLFPGTFVMYWMCLRGEVSGLFTGLLMFFYGTQPVYACYCYRKWKQEEAQAAGGGSPEAFSEDSEGHEG